MKEAEKPKMIDLDNQEQILAVTLIAILGAAAFFQAGLLSAGNFGLLSQDRQQMMDKNKVKNKVQNYVSVTSGKRANATVTSIEKSDKIESFYKVGVELTAKVLNQTRTQQTTVFVSSDGEYIMTGEPQDLDNPQPPQPRTPTVTPETGENQTQ